MIASSWSWRRQPAVAASSLQVSGVIGGVGLVFLIGMFAAFAAGQQSLGMTLGFVNDVTGIVTLPLAVPAMLMLHDRLRPTAGRAGDALLLLALGATIAIAVLQVLLVTRVLPFEQQIGPVSIAFLALGAWFIATGRLAARAGILPHGTRLGVAAAAYVGYPVWAFRLARALRTGAAG
jgi:hypothetical protein